MKTLFLPFLICLSLISAGVDGQDLNISLTGDSNTEQSAKLELIRILQERMNKLTVAQLNSRVIVSTGVVGYYKVDEILTMQKGIYAYRSKYVSKAGQIEAGNSGFTASTGNGFGYRYIQELNSALGKAGIIRDQLLVVVKSGQPIALPPMPTFSITPPTSVDDVAGSFAQTMQGILGQFNVKSQADIDNLPADQKAAFQSAVDAAKAEFEKAMKASMAATTKSSLTLVGNVVGTLVGIPGAGTIIAGLASGGGAGALAGLVGSVVDKFQIPTDYYDSPTLKLTDAERIKIIDELHVRMSELYQQVSALGANLSSETKTRYNELSQPRNDMIMYGPKK